MWGHRQRLARSPRLVGAILALGLACVPTSASSTARDLIVHVLDDARRLVGGAEVEIMLEREDGSIQVRRRYTDRSGKVRFGGVLVECNRVHVRARVGDRERRSRIRDCREVREIFIVLPGSSDARPEVAMSDRDGNPLPPPPPAVSEEPLVLDPKFASRYRDPGVFEMHARGGFDFCNDSLVHGAAGCGVDYPAGASTEVAWAVHLLGWWKLSFAVGAIAGYRFDRGPVDDMPDASYESHMLTAGPRLVVQAGAGDWVFGLEGVPLGAIHRKTSTARSAGPALDDPSFGAARPETIHQSSSANGAFFSIGFFAGWRAWGNAPLGFYTQFVGPVSVGGQERFQPGSTTIGVFAGWRFGPGRAIWAIGED